MSLQEDIVLTRGGCPYKRGCPHKRGTTVLVFGCLQYDVVNNTTNEQTSLISNIEHKVTMTYDEENSGLDLGQAQKCGRVKPVDGIPPSPLVSIE